MVGAPGVGKSSLVRRFVHSIFSEDYSSTLGVKVDRKLVLFEQAAVSMVLWDMHGETEGLDVPPGYLRGASGALAVFDISRPETAATAATLLERVLEQSPNAETVAVANKDDFEEASEASRSVAESIEASSIQFTSAKTGSGVEQAFGTIGQGLLERAGLWHPKP